MTPKQTLTTVARDRSGPYSARYKVRLGGIFLPREQRRLAAIVSADVAGYSRLMGRDESGTLGALKRLRREVIDPENQRT